MATDVNQNDSSTNDFIEDSITDLTADSTTDSVESIVTELTNADLLTQAQIAKRLGVSVATVSVRIGRMGLRPVVPRKNLGDGKGWVPALYSYNDFAVLEQQQQAKIQKEKAAHLAAAAKAVKPDVRVEVVRDTLETIVDEGDWKNIVGIAMMMAQGMAGIAMKAEKLEERNRELEARIVELDAQIEEQLLLIEEKDQIIESQNQDNTKLLTDNTKLLTDNTKLHEIDRRQKLQLDHSDTWGTLGKWNAKNEWGLDAKQLAKLSKFLGQHYLRERIVSAEHADGVWSYCGSDIVDSQNVYPNIWRSLGVDI